MVDFPLRVVVDLAPIIIVDLALRKMVDLALRKWLTLDTQEANFFFILVWNILYLSKLWTRVYMAVT